MAYRKTEKVLATLEARRNSILASAIDVIAKSGMEGLTTDAVAARAGIAAGLTYKYFADKDELVAAMFAHLLARDVAAMKVAAGVEKDPLQALATAMAVFFGRLDNAHLVRAMTGAPIYQLGVRTELERLIQAADLDLTPKARTLAAAGAVGALYGFVGVSDGSKNRAPTALLFVLRGIGVSDAVARKVLARMYGQAMVPA
jgi:AcrR family transcriptional regulator